MNSAVLDRRHGEALLRLARAAMADELTPLPSSALARVRGELSDQGFELWLAEPGATFVTLRDGTRLRGCIGNLRATRPLVLDVTENAIAAATRDPRFNAVNPAELSGLTIEVSLLGAQTRIEAAAESDVLTALRPHVDGVVVRFGEHRSTFLPQVWEQLPEPAEFLAQLKGKAGLAADFWHEDLEVSRYSVHKWSEEPPAVS